MTDLSIDLRDMPAASEEELRTRYRAVVGAQTVRRQGETVPLRRLRSDLESPDRRRRERAWRLESACWLEDAPAISELWRSMVSIRAKRVFQDGQRSRQVQDRQSMGDSSTASDDGRRAQLAVEEFVTSVLVRLHERRRLQLGLRTIRPWDLCTLPSGFPVEPLFATQRDVFEAVDRALSRIPQESGAILTAPHVPSDPLQSDAEVEGLLAEWGEALAQPTMPDPARIGRQVDDVARVALPLLVLHGSEDVPEGAGAPTSLRRVRIRHLESRLLSWTFGAMIDAFEEWAYSQPDRVHDEDVTGTIWSSLWLRFLPAVDWAGLQDILKVDWQRHDALFLRPGDSVIRISRELEVFKTWRQAKDSPDWFQGPGSSDRTGAYPLRSAPAINDQDLLRVARWIEDTIEDLEGCS